MTLRVVLGVVSGLVVAALGALILGEYEFTGQLPYVAGPLFGLVVGEVVIAVGRSRSTVVAAVTALVALGGIAWAGWIDSSSGLEPVKAAVWVSAAIAAVVAFLRIAGLRHRRHQG